MSILLASGMPCYFPLVRSPIWSLEFAEVWSISSSLLIAPENVIALGITSYCLCLPSHTDLAEASVICKHWLGDYNLALEALKSDSHLQLQLVILQLQNSGVLSGSKFTGMEFHILRQRERDCLNHDGVSPTYLMQNVVVLFQSVLTVNLGLFSVHTKAQSWAREGDGIKTVQKLFWFSMWLFV